MGDTQKKPSYLKTFTMQVVSGGSAGFIEVCCMQPLDVVKTRMQLQNNQSGGANKYNGVFDCFRKIYLQEGILSFWKGIIPPIVVETPKRSIKFVGFEQFKTLFTNNNSKATPLTFGLAGFSAGILEGLLVTPFELIKITQQANRLHVNEAPGSWNITKNIIEMEGVIGLYKGLVPCMVRNGVFNMAYFGFYHTVKNIIPENKDRTLEFIRKALIGFTSGILGCIFNIPFDVVKSRIQGPQPVPGEIKYKKGLSTFKIIIKEEGVGALYKGLAPKVMRLGPGGAIMLLIFEHVFDFLNRRFPN